MSTFCSPPPLPPSPPAPPPGSLAPLLPASLPCLLLLVDPPLPLVIAPYQRLSTASGSDALPADAEKKLESFLAEFFASRKDVSAADKAQVAAQLGEFMADCRSGKRQPSEPGAQDLG